MYSLIVDSSTKRLYICLVENDKTLYEVYVEGKNDHAKNIVHCIDEALKKANIVVDDLDRIVVGYGPGSYTGVRMAVTVCKMMAVFKKIPMYCISTLQLMASGFDGIVLASIDARRGNAFAGAYAISTNEIILQDGLYPYTQIDEGTYDYRVNEDTYKVNPIYCIENAVHVEEPHLLVPNYLRETEAERNLG